jgi:hypothetical protein
MTSIRSKPATLFLLEFNELCPSLLEKFMAEGKLPNFRRFYETSAVYTTDAEEDPPNLEPWIQWMTIHSGMSFAEHGAFHLGDGRKVEERCLAELLSDAGIRVGVFGSMNTNYSTLNGYYLPDPWDAHGAPQPAWLNPFYKVVAKQVQESSAGGGMDKRDLLRFGSFMARNGIRLRTLTNTARQLVREKADRGVSWRRASLLEELQYDLFRRLDRQFRPQFATFFCNSTAHYQHYYWRNMHPEIFEMAPDAGDHPSLRTAIEYGYARMDRLVGQFLRDFPHVVLVLCTALSQKPWTETTKCTFRPVDFLRLMEFAGIGRDEVQIEPVMAEQFHAVFASDERAALAAEQLAALTLDGQSLMVVERNGRNMFTGCSINDPLAMQGAVTGPGGRSLLFRELFHMVHSMRSGRHHPDGVLWVRTGRHRVELEKVSLRDIAPTVLEFFGVSTPPSMQGTTLNCLQPAGEATPVAI